MNKENIQHENMNKRSFFDMEINFRKGLEGQSPFICATGEASPQIQQISDAECAAKSGS
jgi:hypothetical protein